MMPSTFDPNGAFMRKMQQDQLAKKTPPTPPATVAPPAPVQAQPNAGMGNYTQNLAMNSLKANVPTPSAAPGAGMANYGPRTPTGGPTPSVPQQPTVQQPAAPQPVQNPVYQPSPSLQDVGSLTSAGSNATGYINSQADRLGKDPGAITEAGGIYAQRTTDALKGEDPLVKNAQQTEDTAASMRQYTATKAAQESLGQSHFAPGSAQYNRAIAKSQAGVDVANQQGQSAVNDYTRKRTADNMAAAAGLETQQYNRNSENLKNAVGMEDNARANAVGERTHKEGRESDAINGLPEGAARNTARNLIAGGMSPEEAVQTILSKTGQVNPQYAGSDPGKLKVEGVQKEAAAWVTATNPNLKPGTPEFNAAVTKRMVDTDTAVQSPVTNAKSTSDLNAAKGVLANNPEQLDDTQREALVKSGDIPSFKEVSAVPVGDAAKALKGKEVKVGNEFYTVVDGGSVITNYEGVGQTNKHKDYTTIRSKDGSLSYVVDGKLTKTQPKNVAKPKGTDRLFNSVGIDW